VESQFWVDVPYPGKYIEVGFTAADAKLNDDVNLSLSIANKGNQSLSSVAASIAIYQNGEQIDTVNILSSSVASGDSIELSGKWKGKSVGIYNAVATVTYDGSVRTAEAVFKVGDILMEITGVSSGGITEGNIGKIGVDVQSFWVEDIEGVYAEIEVNGQKVKTESMLLHAWENATLNAFWDTKGVKAGEYPATVTLHYAGKTASKAAIIRVQPDYSMFIYAGTAIITLIVLIILFKRSKRKGSK
jgi:hypothetical protein